MRTACITLTLAGISLSPATACGPATSDDDSSTGDPPATGSTSTATTADTSEPPTSTSTTPPTTDTGYTSYNDTGYYSTEPYECYVDEDCGPEMVCVPPGCVELPDLPPCVAPLKLDLTAVDLLTPDAGITEVVLLDADGDDDLDAAVVQRVPAQVALFLGDGAGSFTSAGEFPLAPGSEPAQAVAFDLDADMNPDLLVLSSADAGSLTILRNTGGSFAAPVAVPLAPRPDRFAVADVDGDTSPDLLVVGQSTPALDVHLGDGMGSFGPSLPDNGPSALYTDVAVAEFTGDANPDVAIAGSFDIDRAQGNGDGTFNGLAGLGSLGLTISARVVLADIDGGGLDIIAGKQRTDGGTLLRYLGVGGGDFGPREEWFLPGQVDRLVVVDLDADGQLEAATLDDGASEILVTFNLAAGPACSTSVTNDDDEQLRALTAGDLDTDGRADLVAIAGDQLRAFLPRP